MILELIFLFALLKSSDTSFLKSGRFILAIINKSEKLMHNKENHEQADFYKKIGEVIRKYKEVIIFGPTKAKNELLNILKADHHFTNIKMEVLSADKMNENEQHKFVKDYFSKQQIRF